MIDYVSLHNHTSFSLMRALAKPADLFERAKKLNQSAVGVTDYGTLAGMWDCYKASKKTGVKMIAGCEFNFVNDISNEDSRFRSLVLLAKNAQGYRNLLTLNKKGFDNFKLAFKKPQPRIDWTLLDEHKEGLICLSGDGNGVISQLLMSRDFDAAKDQALRLKNMFRDSFALELQPHDLTRKLSPYSGEIDQRFINKKLKELSQEIDVRAVAATDVYYLNSFDHRAHDVTLAIGSGQPIGSGNRLTFHVDEFHVKSAIEVANYFIRKGHQYSPDFIRSLLDTSVDLANMCEQPDWIDPKFTNPSGKELPEFPVHQQMDYDEFLEWKKTYADNHLPDDVLYMRYRCERGFTKKVPAGKEAEYRERLNEELDVLEYHGFSSYMLIVYDYVQHAKRNGIPVGPGRGSVGGSLVGYLLGIHIVDPIKYGLIFARFHNKEKTSFPDIDLDFSTAGREGIIRYIQRKYGEDYVAHVSNVNTVTPKVYVRDIARAFEFGDAGRSESAKVGNSIADSISAEIKTVKSALEKAPLFIEWTKEHPELAEFAETIGGAARAWSTHAGGILIGKRPLVGLIPLRKDADNNTAVEYDKDRAEENGLVKMDILGLTTLDIIADTYKIIKSVGKPLPPYPPDFEQYDQKTYDLIASGNTSCVFQLGDTAIGLCKSIKPKSVLDIAYITALVRPAAEDIREDFVKTRAGEKEVELMHPTLERAFGDTYGFGIFEECLMYLAQDVAGWDLHSADRLRKLTKEKGKNPEKAKKWREEFIADAQANKGLTKRMATKIWDQVVEKFQGYGFNRSHAILYSIISFYTAYLKAHYPLEFLVANLMFQVNSNSPKAKDNIQRIKDEIRSLGVNIVAPDINKSEISYKIIDDKTLMTGLDSMKYMGTDVIPEILQKRPFNSFEDFITRVEGIRAQSVQALAACGCLDSFNLTRRQMFLYASDYKQKLRAHRLKIKKSGADIEFKYPWPENEGEWTIREKYALEHYYLGEGISGTITQRFEGFFDHRVTNFAQLHKIYPYRKQSDNERENRKKNSHYIPGKGKVKSLKGIVVSAFSFTVKKEGSKILGQEMARINVQDPWGNDLTIIAFPESWQHIQRRIGKEFGEKGEFEAGIAIEFDGIFQHENEHMSSFIINDILDYRPAPTLPEDLKSRKVKMPRAKKKSKKEVEELNKESLAEELEVDMIDAGINPIDDEEDDDVFDPFK